VHGQKVLVLFVTGGYVHPSVSVTKDNTTHLKINTSSSLTSYTSHIISFTFL